MLQKERSIAIVWGKVTMIISFSVESGGKQENEYMLMGKCLVGRERNESAK